MMTCASQEYLSLDSDLKRQGQDRELDEMCRRFRAAGGIEVLIQKRP
jgi:hypothetical protein